MNNFLFVDYFSFFPQRPKRLYWNKCSVVSSRNKRDGLKSRVKKNRDFIAKISDCAWEQQDTIIKMSYFNFFPLQIKNFFMAVLRYLYVHIRARIEIKIWWFLPFFFPKMKKEKNLKDFSVGAFHALETNFNLICFFKPPPSVFFLLKWLFCRFSKSDYRWKWNIKRRNKK